jgi:hypothetical protein|tara:strand:- start:71 stop:394 length:324 start_codon:yes stop_codon:yes gene_type:complete
MNLTNKDYLEILKFYNIDDKKLKKSEIKNKAEKILITKLCRCIKTINKFNKYNEKESIPICTNSVLKKKKITSFKFTCKKNPKFLLLKKKLTKKNNKNNKKNNKPKR